MSELPANEVMKFADEVIAEENATRPYRHWTEADVRGAIFAAIVAWEVKQAEREAVQ